MQIPYNNVVWCCLDTAILHVCTVMCPFPVLEPCRRWLTFSLSCPFALQAAREIAGTIAQSANRVFLNAESLLLNLGDLKPMAGEGKK